MTDAIRWETFELYRKLNGPGCDDCEMLGGPLPASVVLASDYEALQARCAKLEALLRLYPVDMPHEDFMTEEQSDALDRFNAGVRNLLHSPSQIGTEHG